MKDSYAGKIKNSGQQAVEAVFTQPKTNKSKVMKGGDLRANPSKIKK